MDPVASIIARRRTNQKKKFKTDYKPTLLHSSPMRPREFVDNPRNVPCEPSAYSKPQGIACLRVLQTIYSIAM